MHMGWGLKTVWGATEEKHENMIFHMQYVDGPYISLSVGEPAIAWQLKSNGECLTKHERTPPFNIVAGFKCCRIHDCMFLHT